MPMPDINTAREVLKAKKSRVLSEAKKRKESTENLIQSYLTCKDTKQKERLLLIIRRNNPDFSGK